MRGGAVAPQDAVGEGKLLRFKRLQQHHVCGATVYRNLVKCRFLPRPPTVVLPDYFRPYASTSIGLNPLYFGYCGCAARITVMRAAVPQSAVGERKPAQSDFKSTMLTVQPQIGTWQNVGSNPGGKYDCRCRLQPQV